MPPLDISGPLMLSTSLRRIRVGDVARDVTEPDLRALFLAFGPIRSYVRPLDRLTGRPGDAVLIEMAEPTATEAVRALDGRLLRNRLLTVTAYVVDAVKQPR